MKIPPGLRNHRGKEGSGNIELVGIDGQPLNEYGVSIDGNTIFCYALTAPGDVLTVQYEIGAGVVDFIDVVIEGILRESAYPATTEIRKCKGSIKKFCESGKLIRKSNPKRSAYRYSQLEVRQRSSKTDVVAGAQDYGDIGNIEIQLFHKDIGSSSNDVTISEGLDVAQRVQSFEDVASFELDQHTNKDGCSSSLEIGFINPTTGAKGPKERVTKQWSSEYKRVGSMKFLLCSTSDLRSLGFGNVPMYKISSYEAPAIIGFKKKGPQSNSARELDIEKVDGSDDELSISEEDDSKSLIEAPASTTPRNISNRRSNKPQSIKFPRAEPMGLLQILDHERDANISSQAGQNAQIVEERGQATVELTSSEDISLVNVEQSQKLANEVDQLKMKVKPMEEWHQIKDLRDTKKGEISNHGLESGPAQAAWEVRMLRSRTEEAQSQVSNPDTIELSPTQHKEQLSTKGELFENKPAEEIQRTTQPLEVMPSIELENFGRHQRSSTETEFLAATLNSSLGFGSGNHSHGDEVPNKDGLGNPTKMGQDRQSSETPTEVIDTEELVAIRKLRNTISLLSSQVTQDTKVASPDHSSADIPKPEFFQEDMVPPPIFEEIPQLSVARPTSMLALGQGWELEPRLVASSLGVTVSIPEGDYTQSRLPQINSVIPSHQSKAQTQEALQQQNVTCTSPTAIPEYQPEVENQPLKSISVTSMTRPETKHATEPTGLGSFHIPSEPASGQFEEKQPNSQALSKDLVTTTSKSLPGAPKPVATQISSSISKQSSKGTEPRKPNSSMSSLPASQASRKPNAASAKPSTRKRNASKVESANVLDSPRKAVLAPALRDSAELERSRQTAEARLIAAQSKKDELQKLYERSLQVKKMQQDAEDLEQENAEMERKIDAMYSTRQ
ncbi:hypothetical protein B0O99DRAFT_738961 [Bisporella sp. PMI_857]|nr:hypothetical protein B0O99DRAFT_738961 [Bisporella sp. PMI_857]